MDEFDFGDEYARRVTIDGTPKYEIGVRDVDGEGYIVDYVGFDINNNNVDEIRAEIKETIDDLHTKLEDRDTIEEESQADSWPISFF